MMDGFVDHLFSSSSCVDGDVKEKLSWGYAETGEPNVLLPTSLRPYENDKRSSPLSMISEKQSLDYSPTQDTSSLVFGSESDYADDKGLISAKAQLRKGSQNCNGRASPVMSGCLKIGNMGLQYGTALPILDSIDLSYPKQLPVADELTSSLSFNEAGNARRNGSEQFEYNGSFEDLQNLSSMSQVWPSASYEGVSSVSAVMGQERMQQFGLQKGNLNNDIDFLRKRYVCMDQIQQLDRLSASVTTKDKEDLHGYPFSSFAAGPNVTMATDGIASAAPADGSNGTGKLRVRARRGQATDPHSIAERLRREKIAERMKNLQELVPNATKIDKASMLDEIIEYVKFLQLQVKVLSMSRLGAAGAVIPLITDGQAEGSKSLSLSPSAGLGLDISPSPDQIAFEQEVLELMESNVTAAIQYLQSKGLCVMPLALASAISSGKASLPGIGSEEKKKFSLTNGLVQSNSGCSCSSSSSSSCSIAGVETHQMFHDGNVMTANLIGKGTMTNGCNGMVELEKEVSFPKN